MTNFSRWSWVSTALAGVLVTAGTATAMLFGIDVPRRLGIVDQAKLETSNHQPGDPVFIRIFKRESELEVWSLDRQRNLWSLAKIYPICRWSGALGPKLKEGDGQSPEGFYEVTLASLNPNSSYHLSFNLGFPNAYDSSLGRTGSYLMVHGSCVSIGCYAMTDKGIEEIYGAVEASLRSPQGQTHVPVHVFPFRFESAIMSQAPDASIIDFWEDLKGIHRDFATSGAPQNVFACGSDYSLQGGEGCTLVSRLGLKPIQGG